MLRVRQRRGQPGRAVVAFGGWVAGWAALAAAVVASGCKDKPTVLAELVAASGPVERADAKASEERKGAEVWGAAALGARFYLGDAVRTGDGTAQLSLGEAQRLDMEPHTLLRFGRGRGAGDQTLSVELGSIEIAGGGEYQLDVGDISVKRNGGVRITADEGGPLVELLVGEASIRKSGGELTPLAPGVTVDFADIEIRPSASAVKDAGPTPGDAAQADAGPLADGGSSGEQVAVEVSGAVELRLSGDKGWKAAPRELSALGPGSLLRVAKGKARLERDGVTLELDKGSVAAVGQDGSLAVVSGVASVRAAAERGGQVGLPGGGLTLPASPKGASAEVLAGSRESRVRATGGEVALVGRDAKLALGRGESALLTKAGALRVLVAIPEVAEVSIAVGDSATIHDSKGAAAVQFRFGDRCPGGGFIELDQSSSFKSPAVSAGAGSANLMVGSGSYSYRLRCDDDEGRTAASGRLSVVRDGGTRALPAAPPPFQFDVDGRTYRVGYQSAIPTMNVVWKNATGKSFTLRLAHAGKDQSFSSTDPFYSIPGSKLSEGTYTVWFEKSGARSKVSTLIIDFDNTAPAVYIDQPDEGAAWPRGEVTVAGAVLPGWAVSVGGVALPLDKQRRFRAQVPAPAGAGGGALAIRVSHPQRGVHYYVRRHK